MNDLIFTLLLGAFLFGVSLLSLGLFGILAPDRARVIYLWIWSKAKNTTGQYDGKRIVIMVLIALAMSIFAAWLLQLAAPIIALIALVVWVFYEPKPMPTLNEQDFAATTYTLFQAMRDCQSRLPMLSSPIDISDLRAYSQLKDNLWFVVVRFYKKDAAKFNADTLEIIKLYLQARLDDLISSANGNQLFIVAINDNGLYIAVTVLQVNSPKAFEYRTLHTTDDDHASPPPAPDTNDVDF